MKINEVEALAGVTKKNIRFYEEEGLLTPRRNSENGYRDYSEDEVETVRRIKLLRKLGVPIPEIRKMQDGRQTVADGMRRHLVDLEREKRNLEGSIRICGLLLERQVPLSELEAQEVLEQMEKLEQAGAGFQDSQRQDIRVRYASSVLAAAVFVLLIAAIAAVFVWGYVTSPEDAPPLWLMAVFMLALLLVIGGVLLALYQRIKEIGRGEADNAKKY